MASNESDERPTVSCCEKIHEAIFGKPKRSPNKNDPNPSMSTNNYPTAKPHVSSTRFHSVPHEVKTSQHLVHFSSNNVKNNSDDGEYNSYINQMKKKMSAPSNVVGETSVCTQDSFNDTVSNFIGRTKIRLIARPSVSDVGMSLNPYKNAIGQLYKHIQATIDDLKSSLMAKTKQNHMSQGSSTSSKRTPPLCRCDKEAKLRTSTTEKNPQKKFYNCPNSLMKKEKKCKFFRWVDSEGEDDSEDEEYFNGGTVHELLKEIKVCKELMESSLDEAKKLKRSVLYGCILIAILIGCIVFYN